MAFSLVVSVFTHFTAFPLITILTFLAVICFATRVITGLRQSFDRKSLLSPRTPVVLPYWIPWLGHALQFGRGFQSFIIKARVVAREDTFAIILGGSRHNIVTQPSLTAQILNLRQQVSAGELPLYFVEKFWADHGTTRRIEPEAIWKSIHPVLYQLSREPFLSKAIQATVSGVEDTTYNLISFSHSFVDQLPWERTSNVSVHSGPQQIAEADLYPLIRDFVGDIACRVLMGRDFQANFPNVMEDLWTVDGKFSTFIMGVPGWAPGMIRAAAARERVIDAVAEHAQAILDMLDGKDAGSRWSDDLLTDCSRVVVERARAYRDSGSHPRARAAGGAALLWAMMVNANQVIFWMIFHVYSMPQLLAQIREEIAPFVKIEDSDSELPIKSAPKLSIDMNGLMKECPLLKATFFETMRCDALSSSTKVITEDFDVTESLYDAQLQGRSTPFTYHFSRGEVLWMMHAVHQKDARHWLVPDKFDPKRFWVEDEEDPSKVSVEYKTMKVWGGGMTICKGRGFAEAEVVVFAAAIYAMWDIEALDGWKHPGHSTGGGTAQPQKNTRVRLQKRV